jgi:hypothetical protein
MTADERYQALREQRQLEVSGAIEGGSEIVLGKGSETTFRINPETTLSIHVEGDGVDICIEPKAQTLEPGEVAEIHIHSDSLFGTLFYRQPQL